MAKTLLVALLAAALISLSEGDFKVSCINATAFQLSTEVYGRTINTPAASCPPGQVCDAGGPSPCVARQPAGGASSFKCVSMGTFPSPDPCSPTVYLCLPGEGGYRLLNATCGAGGVYDASSGNCVPAPVTCRAAGEDFECPTHGRFPAKVCNQYHVCYRVRWALQHRLATCYGTLEYSSLKRKCVPRWYSDCGLQRNPPAWRKQILVDGADESSEEIEDYIDEDKYKKIMKKFQKSIIR